MKLSTEKLNLAMARSCLSIGDLCERSGIPRPTLSQVRRGTRNPQPKTIGRIAKALNIDPSELLEQKEA